MRRLLLSTGAAALLAIAVVATVAAAGPMGRAGGAGATERAGAQSTVVADILGLSRDAIEDLRHDGLSLAQIAEKQKVDPQRLVDTLTTQWTTRIDARVQSGALTADRATALKVQLATRAKDMVFRTTLGGMQGAAVGAGPASAPGYRNGTGNTGDAGSGMGGRGRGAGNGACDGTGPQATQP
ncbi:MAG: hypothetical protein ABIG85_00870 [Chloroflexota bacterium]